MDGTSVLIEGLELTEPGVCVEVGGVAVSADTVVAPSAPACSCSTGCEARELTVVLQLVEIARRRTEATLTGVVECRRAATALRSPTGTRGPWLVKASAALVQPSGPRPGRGRPD